MCISGLPGVGKSLFVRELARAAHGAGRTVHLLQWDVVRLSFQTPAIEARYPERDGITHAVIRRAVGQWARGAVLRWHLTHPADSILIGEVPIIGHRLLDLVQIQADEVEPLLAGEQTLFMTPVPTFAVRTLIASARGRTTAAPVHAREAGDASPDIVDAAWQEIHAIAAAMRGTSSDVRALYDPQEYAAVYRHLLRHRQSLTLSMNLELEPRTSVYDLTVEAREVLPTADDVAAALARVERDSTAQEIEQQVAGWFDAV